MMKKMFVFDVDNTIYYPRDRKIFPQTLKLLKTISQNPDYLLVLATGRGLEKVKVLGADVVDLFDIMITVNGAIIYHKEAVDYYPMNKCDVKMVVDYAKQEKIAIAMVGQDYEYVTINDDYIKKAYVGYLNRQPFVDDQYYLNNDVYQLWLYHDDQQIMKRFAEKFEQLRVYWWHSGGLDIGTKGISKESAIKKIWRQYPKCELICIGDGHNDLSMIKLADIGIVMGNSDNDELKKHAQLIAPKIEEDRLFDFFKDCQLI
jgi:Cof subfamily protein (haloacid dehalogenase superfamily)